MSEPSARQQFENKYGVPTEVYCMKCDNCCLRIDGSVISPERIRPTVAAFAVAMEAKLRKNDHKTAWRDLPVEALFRQLLIELEEFKVADEFLNVSEARKELVDLANFCLILHDRLGMLDQDKNRHAQPK